MTTQANIPNKWVVPFAEGDSARVELPVTTADPTRASQTLGFPPLTMQPPESGGVPPQGEDFNGGMNQIARVAWWVLNGGGWPYDSTFANDANINGYPNGATLQAADFRGDWISTADGNTNNPDTNGTNWVPGFQYGVTALSGLTGGTVTPTPAQAAKSVITLAGTLTSALTVILPTWLKDWTITNNTTGAFVTIVKTAAGSGITIPQNGAPTRVVGDGTNITQVAPNIAPASSPTQAIQQQQKGVQRFTASGSFTVPLGVTTVYVSGVAGGGGGGGGGGVSGVSSGTASAGGGGGGNNGQYTLRQAVTVAGGQVLTVTIGAAGGAGSAGAAGGIGGTGGTGGNTTVTGSSPTVNVSLTGGTGGSGGIQPPGNNTGGPGGAAGGAGAGQGDYGLAVSGYGSNYGGKGGIGGASPFGSPGVGATNLAGSAAQGFGAGGGGGSGQNTASSIVGLAGGAGAGGFIVIEW